LKNSKTKKSKDTTWELYLASVVMGLMLNTFNIADFALLGINIGTWMVGLGAGMYVFDVIDNINPYRKLFENTGLEAGEQIPKFLKKTNTQYGYDLIFSLPPGLSSKQFEQKQTEIEEYLGGSIKINVKNRKLTLQVYTREIKDFYKYEYINTNNILEIPLGYTHGNKLLTLDLEKVTHLLIAGQTDAGKSTLLRGILTSIILSGKNVVLHLIDLKNGAEFNVFRCCRQVRSFCKNEEEAEQTLKELIKEVDRRYGLFYEVNVVDIREYNRLRGVKKLDYQVVVIDEFATFIKEKNSISSVELLASKARACGIHLIISTQRPDMKVLNGRIKANIPCVIGLRTLDATNSRIIIEANGLEKLTTKGRAILKYDEMTEFQPMFITVKQARKLIKHTYIEKEIPKVESKVLPKATNIKPKKIETVNEKEKVGQVEDFSFLQVLKGGKE